MSYDFTPPSVVNRILIPGQTLDIDLEQALDAIRQLAGALKEERTKLALATETLTFERARNRAAELKHVTDMSDLEIRLSNRPAATRKSPDGVRYANPPSPTIGPDGFPQRGII